MKTKELLEDEEKQQSPLIKYDRSAIQNIPMQVDRSGKVYSVSIDLNPITDEDYFKLTDEIPENTKRVKTVSIDLFSPFANLGRRLAVARHGFKEREDWRDATDDAYFINAVKGFLECSAVHDGIQTDELLDDDAEIKISLKSNYNGKECLTAIYFREETKAEMDEFFAILNNAPRKGVLASAKKLSKERRLFSLYEAMSVRSEDYERNDVPAWHAVQATESFLLLQFARVGKPELS